MITIPSNPVFIPGPDPVAEHTSDDKAAGWGVQPLARHPGRPGTPGTPGGHPGRPGTPGGHPGRPGGTPGSHPGTPGGQGHQNINTGGSYNGAPNPNIVKPAPKPGQDVDSTGWPVNKSKQRVDADGHAIDNQGRRINEKNQLVNEKNQTINERGQWINERNQTLNTRGEPVDSYNRRIDSQDRLINRDSRLINDKGQLVDKDKKLVNKEGYLVDNIGRPLDKDGKVARSKQDAVQGNNEPHPQLAGMNSSLTSKPDTPAAPNVPKPTIEGSVNNAAKTDELVKRGWLPSKQELGKTFILGAVSGVGESLAALPINVASSAISHEVTKDSIKQKYLPAPLASSTPAPTGGDKSSESMTDAEKAKQAEEAKKQAQYASIDNLQVASFDTQRTLNTLEFGALDTELVPGDKWPADALGRLDMLERRLDDMEEQAKRIQDEYSAYYKVAELPADPPAAGAEGIDARVKTLELRLYAVNKLRDRAVESAIKARKNTPADGY
ncbi:hypothetical protein [Pseudomonas sp. Marseille-Q1929]|uniref:hypothetical protein n=1 Tax=Pseudomonas sp. Marseille-Q1929 TaxID=2730402 RepID=UPI001A8F81CF|nr:hypothetical protein [Pseudomonas sp. Marseille-Q1929]MBO0494531.1 hypothetical protein [Pseudomonas sp. Marseille-Q1929]